ncbi:uncharacterized protein [Venturia canescens]|uniref:uncharacterized protein n=1 Tax=Venturia canescens TaxID=32260 RepID=UPI001C9D0DC1|nr:uncharacterized protein LOC122410260 [Venturia canescens]
MRVIPSIYLVACVASMTSGSLLEMSQTLWTKALQGGLTKIGALDPLRIPIVKVDQSEGSTSYRMILRSVEIRGLNSSTLESIHLGRGRLKSNLSEHEAGYVSYTDQHDIDMIRYRFHTVVKEPRVEESQNLEVESIPGLEKSRFDGDSHRRVSSSEPASADRGRYQTPSRYRDNQEQAQGQRIHHERPSSRHENDRARPYEHRSNYDAPNRRPDDTRRYGESANVQASVKPECSGSYPASGSYQVNSRHSVNAQNPPERVRIVYAEKLKNPENNYETIHRGPSTESPPISGCSGGCEYRRNSYNLRRNQNQQRNDFNNRQVDAETGAATNYESRRAHVNARVSAPGDVEDFRGRIRNTESRTTFDARIDEPNNYPRNRQPSRESSTSQRLENQPGYVDIVYADEKDQKMRHFGNLRVQPEGDKKVYSLDDVFKDLRDHNRFIVHNFTEGESLKKKNDAVRTASETRRIEDLVRYAKDFQEKHGYYEEGMQLIYHYGGKEGDLIIKDSEGRRTKRAHLDEEDEEDVMHVIMKIRVPMLRVAAGYVLTGTVGKQVLRGNGLLTANFTELIGDFTLELKKVDDDTMVVRAARARLTANDQKITLQGMDEEGPVNQILTQGLVAAEAVAAMLADDLTTKALSEKTADSIIYRMYKNLPSEN